MMVKYHEKIMPLSQAKEKEKKRNERKRQEEKKLLENHPKIVQFHQLKIKRREKTRKKENA
jgi:hypothetical protein